MCEESGFVLEVNERALYDQTLERLRGELDGADFDAEWADGHRADPDSAAAQIDAALT